MKKIKLLISILMIFIALPAISQDVTPYKGSRIFWDLGSYKTIFPTGVYGRLIQLQDGRLMAISLYGGLGVTYSSNLGKTWTTPVSIFSWPAGYQFGVPELVQLADGTILVGINTVPLEPFSDDRKFGIRVIRSTDNGATWSEMIFVYDGKSTKENCCWEPSFLELPSGELQLYFTNEFYNSAMTSKSQRICMSRSFDGGLTWGEPITTSFRDSYKIGDGMAIPVLLKDQSEIVYTVEDMGWTGRPKFTTTTIRTTLEDNWSSGPVGANSHNRSIIFQEAQPIDVVSAAPYLKVLPNGETVASYQGNEHRTLATEQYYDMTVVVGDDRARNFKAKSRPLAVASNMHSLINSIAVIDTGVVVAVGSVGKAETSDYRIDIIKGYPMQRATANYGTITVDGKKTSAEKWTTTTMDQIKMGHEIKNRTGIDFLYDNEYLYVTARVVDYNICDTASFNDGIRLMIDADNVSSANVKAGLYKLNFDANGTVKFYAGKDKSWILGDASGIDYKLTKAASYYFFEAAIPWSKLGKDKAPVDQRMAIATTLVNVYPGNWATEDIADVDVNASWTWLEFRLNQSSGIENVVQDDNAISQVNTRVESNILHFDSAIDMKNISLFAIDGKLLDSANDCGLSYDMQLTKKGIGIARVWLSNGRMESKKYLY